MKLLKLKENRDFRRTYHKGKSYVSPFIVLYVNKTKGNGVRLGITAGKKVGKAVLRNRAKRLITAAFRSILPQIELGYDFVIVARTRILDVKSTEVATSLLSLLKSAGALKSIENEEIVD